MKNNLLRVILSVVIVLILSFSNSLVGAGTICMGDFEPDGDVDGSDLAFLINPGGFNLELFASEFGRADCALVAQITLSQTTLSRTAIQGGPNPDPQTFTIQNTGNMTLEYSITEDADWLYVSPVTISLNSGETDIIPVLYEIVTPVTLDSGTYNATITISGTTSLTGEPVPERTIDVTLNVDPASAELIINNDDPGTSYSGGSWGYSSGDDPYGGSSREESLDEATYTFQGTVTGYQEVSLWWTYLSDRCSAVLVDIYDGSMLLTTVEVNQQELSLAGQWNVLGSYQFSGTAKVVLRAQDGCSTCADAVKFSPIQRLGYPSIVIDNRDSEVSDTGVWDVSGATNPYEVDSVWSRDGATFTWSFSPVVSGYCKVYLRWTNWSSRSEDVPVDIQHEDGTATAHVDQQQNGEQWNRLGQYNFGAGTTYDVTITAQPGPSSTSADAVKFEYITNEPFVTLTMPQDYFLQTSSNLYVVATAGNLDSGWGVKFVLDMGTADERVISDFAGPYEGVFTGLTQIEHTLDAFIVNESGNTVSGSFTHDQKVQIGIGQYYVAVGDSITEGFGDDDPSDDKSLDGRNTGGGYEPILNNVLTVMKGIPHTVVNKGVGGATSADGADFIDITIAENPLSQRFLIGYGTNDARPWLLPVPSGLGLNPGDSGYLGSFKDNMQYIIDAVNTASKEACLAKAPITLGDSTDSTPYDDPDLGARSVLVKEFNQVIDELADDPSNNILVVPPDFYGLFNEDVSGEKRYESEYFDNLHPDGEGYPSMAGEWGNVLVP